MGVEGNRRMGRHKKGGRVEDEKKRRKGKRTVGWEKKGIGKWREKGKVDKRVGRKNDEVRSLLEDGEKR